MASTKKKHPELVALGKRIREARLKAGMSQEKLAEATGMSTTYLAMVERGEGNIGYLFLKKITTILRGEIF